MTYAYADFFTQGKDKMSGELISPVIQGASRVTAWLIFSPVMLVFSVVIMAALVRVRLSRRRPR
jgi:hypothetical protein